MIADVRDSGDYRMKLMMRMLRGCCVSRRDVEPYISRVRNRLLKIIPFDVPGFIAAIGPRASPVSGHPKIALQKI
jgi:hypothetical protein